MRRLFVLGVAAVGAASLALAVPVLADASDDARLASLTTGARGQDGLAAYVRVADLDAAAQRQAERMAAAHGVFHDPQLGSDVCCWQSLGENVGSGPDVDSVHNAFMHSAEHRDNILSRQFTQVGIGTVRSSDGSVYVDETFRQPTGAAAPPPQPPPTGSPASVPAASAASRSAIRPALPARPADVLAARLRQLADQPVRRGDPVAAAFSYYAVLDRLTGG